MTSTRYSIALKLGPLLVAVLGPTTSAPAQTLNTELVGHWDGFGGSYGDVWGDGDYAYVAHFGSASIDIVDVSDPSRPALAAFYPLPAPNGSASAQDVKVADGLLFIGLEGIDNSVHIVDVRDPENPVGLVDVTIPGYGHIHNVFYDQGYLYLADSSSTRVGIVDLTGFDPDNPPESPITQTKWIVQNVGSSFVHDVTLVDGRLYASAWDSGVWIYDVTNVATEIPSFMGSGDGDNTHSCWPTGDGQYVITGEERTGGGITVYRITEDGPSSVSLEVTDSFAYPSNEAFSVHNQVTIGHRVYNSWYEKGFQVFDVDPVSGELELVAFYESNPINSTWGVYPFLGPDRILLSDIGSGLIIVDVDLPSAGDVDGNGVVDVDDLVAVVLAWGDCDPPSPCDADVNGDGTVDVDDLILVVLNWT